MAIYLDFVGLNTLIHEPLSSSTNTIGYQDVISTSVNVRNPQTAKIASKALRSADTTTNQQGNLFKSGFSTLPTTGGFSNSFWIKLDDTTVETRRIWETEDSTGNSTRFALGFNTDGLSYYASDSSTNNKRWDWNVDFSSFLSWKHIVVTWDGNFSSNPVLYTNGTPSSPYFVLDGGGSGTTRADFTRISIFDSDDTSLLYELKGSLQEFALYDIELNQSQVNEIYNDGKKYNLSSFSSVGNILNYWKLGEELTSLSIGDSVPNGTTINATIGTVHLEARDNITVTQGFYGITDALSYENTLIAAIPYGTSLAALNIHRNGPYGFSTFKQIRTSHNPLTRHHNANSTFSYVIDGKEIKTNARQSFIPKHGALRQIEESPIVSNNKPLTMIGGVSEFNRRTLKTYIERVEVQASPANEIQFFGDKQANRDFGSDDDTHESYEHLTDLYLDGGIDSDDSPIDQFEMLRYQHQIYPRETNSYLEHVRGRYIEWEPGYWKDKQSERIKTNVDNGFGNTIPSQSIWPLDVEDDWQSRTLLSTIGHFTMSSPSNFVFGATKTVSDGFSLPNYLGGAYFWAFDPIHTSISHSWDSGTGEGKIYGKKYGMNSQTGTGLFYDSWIDLFEEADIRIVSSDPKSLTTTKIKDINVRHNISTKDINFQNSDTFYMEIDDASAFTTIESELSHSMVHFWTKDEVSEVGYIYREMDDQGALKRSIKNNTGNYFALQAAVFTITDEDGTTNTLTGSTDDTGLLTFLYGDGATTPNMGNEWNNNIITFGDPVQKGSGSISLHVNGAQIDHTNLNDQLNFFNPSGDMNTTPASYDAVSSITRK